MSLMFWCSRWCWWALILIPKQTPKETNGFSTSGFMKAFASICMHHFQDGHAWRKMFVAKICSLKHSRKPQQVGFHRTCDRRFPWRFPWLSWRFLRCFPWRLSCPRLPILQMSALIARRWSCFSSKTTSLAFWRLRDELYSRQGSVTKPSWIPWCFLICLEFRRIGFGDRIFWISGFRTRHGRKWFKDTWRFGKIGFYTKTAVFRWFFSVHVYKLHWKPHGVGRISGLLEVCGASRARQ